MKWHAGLKASDIRVSEYLFCIDDGEFKLALGFVKGTGEKCWAEDILRIA